jgi:hypothetical protein
MFILFFFSCDHISLFNRGDKISTTESEILPVFDCSMAQNISGARGYQDFLALRMSPPSVPFKITEVHVKSLVIESQECEIHSMEYQLYFSPYILQNPMEGELLVANTLEPEGILIDIDILESQDILEVEQVIEQEGYIYVLIDTSEETLCIPHCVTEDNVESLYKRDNQWEIYEAVNGEVDYPFAVLFEW